ncbi:hypothetical protein P4I72_25240 [Paenibacillus alba]|uniref:Uncharacterized protein n=1 Tax=Paenibacillus alba TaxID=1197127 RepID=A0ABU6GCE0_9BACL|nr:hypothetical protein [Paenibacillus alba]
MDADLPNILLSHSTANRTDEFFRLSFTYHMYGLTLQPPIPKPHNPLRLLRNLPTMRNHYNRPPPLIQPPENIHDLHARLGIQRSGRLIRQKYMLGDK